MTETERLKAERGAAYTAWVAAGAVWVYARRARPDVYGDARAAYEAARAAYEAARDALDAAYRDALAAQTKEQTDAE